jgi:hypothetical protein
MRSVNAVNAKSRQPNLPRKEIIISLLLYQRHRQTKHARAQPPALSTSGGFPRLVHANTIGSRLPPQGFSFTKHLPIVTIVMEGLQTVNLRKHKVAQFAAVLF